MTVELLLGAEIDSQQIFNQLEEFSEGRGVFFVEELERTLGLLQTHPEIAPPFHNGFRRKVMTKLPYCLLYKIHGERIFISVIANVNEERDRLIARF